MRNVDQKIGIFINEQSMDINKIYDNIYIYSNIMNPKKYWVYIDKIRKWFRKDLKMFI